MESRKINEQYEIDRILSHLTVHQMNHIIRRFKIHRPTPKHLNRNQCLIIIDNSKIKPEDIMSYFDIQVNKLNKKRQYTR
jgi:hypothetical protein